MELVSANTNITQNMGVEEKRFNATDRFGQQHYCVFTSDGRVWASDEIDDPFAFREMTMPYKQYGRACTRVAILGKDGRPCTMPLVRTDYSLPRPWGYQRLCVWSRYPGGPPLSIQASPRVPSVVALLAEARSAETRIPAMAQTWGNRWPESLVSRDLTVVHKPR